MLRHRHLLGLALAIGLWLTAITLGQADGPASVYPAPRARALVPGATFDLAVRVENVAGVYGFQLELQFDPAVLEVVDADPGRAGVQVQAGDLIAHDLVQNNRADNEAGTVRYAVTQLFPSEPVSGSGDLIRITFAAHGEGVSPIVLPPSGFLLANIDAEVLPASIEAGQVTVRAEAGATPTSTATQEVGTATPTATPTPTPTPTTIQEIGTATPSATQPSPTLTRVVTATLTMTRSPTQTATAPVTQASVTQTPTMTEPPTQTATPSPTTAPPTVTPSPEPMHTATLAPSPQPEATATVTPTASSTTATSTRMQPAVAPKMPSPTLAPAAISAAPAPQPRAAATQPSPTTGPAATPTPEQAATPADSHTVTPARAASPTPLAPAPANVQAKHATHAMDVATPMAEVARGRAVEGRETPADTGRSDMPAERPSSSPRIQVKVEENARLNPLATAGLGGLLLLVAWRWWNSQCH